LILTLDNIEHDHHYHHKSTKDNSTLDTISASTLPSIQNNDNEEEVVLILDESPTLAIPQNEEICTDPSNYGNSDEHHKFKQFIVKKLL